MAEALLSVKNLNVGYNARSTHINILKDISFNVNSAEVVGIVGESGCGKSLTSLSIMRLISEPLRIYSGNIFFDEIDLTKIPKREMNLYRGKEIAMIFQEPMTSLNPVFTVGNQISEAILIHTNLSKSQAMEQTVELMRQVGISSPERRVQDYPHQMSGGMRQRVVIAMALACNPRLLIADEPTTALDVTIQAQILDLLVQIKKQNRMSMIFITHDLGVLSKIADRAIIMYGGRVVESAPIRDLFKSPLHPYTQGLLKAIPLGSRKSRLYNIPGNVPDPKDPMSGCRFAPRCQFATDQCHASEPELLSIPIDEGVGERSVSCFMYH